MGGWVELVILGVGLPWILDGGLHICFLIKHRWTFSVLDPQGDVCLNSWRMLEVWSFYHSMLHNRPEIEPRQPI
jgi:hypothetical protein